MKSKKQSKFQTGAELTRENFVGVPRLHCRPASTAQRRFELLKMSSENYRHPKWQAKRLSILNRDEFKCRFCGDSESELHVHHAVYPRGKKPWEIEDENLVTLCDSCHADAESDRDVFSMIYCRCDNEDLRNLFKKISTVLMHPSEDTITAFHGLCNRRSLDKIIISICREIPIK